MRKFIVKRRKMIFAAVAVLCLLILAASLAASERSYTPAIRATARDAERKDGVYNCLVVGKDRAAGLTDVMFIVSVDVKSNKVNVMQIPRDTYSAYTERDYKKINGAYNSLGGAEELCRYLCDTLCIGIDFYAALEMSDVARIVDILGGVNVDVPMDMDYEDPEQDLYIHIKKGKQMLDGEQAVQFVRYRSGYVEGDIGRVDAQKIFLASLVRRVKNDASWQTLISVASYMIDKTETNANLADCLYFAGALYKIDSSDINFITLPGKEVQSSVSGAWYFVISRDGALDAINRYVNVYRNDVTDAEFDASHKYSNAGMECYESVYRSYIGVYEYSVSTLSELDIKHQTTNRKE